MVKIHEPKKKKKGQVTAPAPTYEVRFFADEAEGVKFDEKKQKENEKKKEKELEKRNTDEEGEKDEEKQKQDELRCHHSSLAGVCLG